MASQSTSKAVFPGAMGQMLAGRLDLPLGPVAAFALFAHCFSCGKDLKAANRIASTLAALGIGVLRFDFTGLGSSEGDFANTSFSSNIEDLACAADYLRRTHLAPAILIGHSLGGAAVLAAAAAIPEARAVVTIGAPADVAHVLSHFGNSLDEILRTGEAEVKLAGRAFKIRRSFVEDARARRLEDSIRSLGKALLVMHAPLDSVVGIDNASRIFAAAKHPKSFVSLDEADHLLSNPEMASYAARVIAAWSSKFVAVPPVKEDEITAVLVRETGQGKFQNLVTAGRHRLLADEPPSVGGLDSGPNPYDFLSIALGTCTAMTLRLYAEQKGLKIDRISVEVSHGKVPAQHCADCGEAVEGRVGQIDRFERIISVDDVVDPAVEAKLVEIAGKCPVHRTLEAKSAVVTKFEHRPVVVR